MKSELVVLLLLSLTGSLAKSALGQKFDNDKNPQEDDDDQGYSPIDEDPTTDDHNGSTDSNYDYNEQYFNYLIACYRGSLQGFSQGFYSNSRYKLNEKCFDQEFSDDVLRLYELTMGYEEP